MKPNVLLNIMIYLFGFLGVTLATILTAIGYYHGKGKHKPNVWDLLWEKKIYLICGTIIFFFISGGLSLYKETASVTLVKTESITQPGRVSIAQPSQVSTVEGIERELKEKSPEAIDYFKVGNHDFKAKRFEDAAKNYQKSLDAFPSMSAYLTLGTCYLILFDTESAERTLTSGLHMARKSGDKMREAGFLIDLGNTCIYKEDLGKALNYFSEAAIIGENLRNAEIQLNVNLSLATLFWLTQKLDKAETSIKKALEISKSIKNQLLQASALNTFGVIYSTQDREKEAEDLLNEAFRTSRAFGPSTVLANVYNNLGNIHESKGEADLAFDYFEKALNINKEIRNLPGQAGAYLNLGEIYRKRRDFDNALQFCSKALEINEQTKSRHGQAAVLLSIGGVYWEKGMDNYLVTKSKQGQKYLEKALQCFNSSLTMSNEIKDLDLKKMALIYIGQTYGWIGKTKEAMDSYREAFKTLQVIPTKKIADATILEAIIAPLFFEQSMLDQCLEILQFTLQIKKEQNEKEGQAITLMMIGNIYIAQGKNQEAKECLKQAKDIYQTVSLKKLDFNGIEQIAHMFFPTR